MPKRLNSRKNTSIREELGIIEKEKTVGKFTFFNGDNYEGEFIVKNGKHFFKEGYGKYNTDNFDIYSVQWNQDNVASDLHIQYNNGMQYKGEINTDGEMAGYGKYIFPDKSSIEGNWKKNEPFSKFKFVEPSGFSWNALKSNNKKEIIFERGNHFWEELYGDSGNENNVKE